MASRTNPNLTDKLAAMIALHFEIPRDHLKTMTNQEVCDLLQWDHDPVPVAIAKSIGWEPKDYNHASNLRGLFAADHQIKTSTKDVPEIAKDERIADGHREFQRRILAKTGQEVASSTRKRKKQWPVRKIKSRGFPKKIRTDR